MGNVLDTGGRQCMNLVDDAPKPPKGEDKRAHKKPKPHVGPTEEEKLEAELEALWEDEMCRLFRRVYDTHDKESRGALSQKEFILFFRDLLMAVGYSEVQADERTTKTSDGVAAGDSIFRAYDLNRDKLVQWSEFWGSEHTRKQLKPRTLAEHQATKRYLIAWKPGKLRLVSTRQDADVNDSRRPSYATPTVSSIRKRTKSIDATGVNIEEAMSKSESQDSLPPRPPIHRKGSAERLAGRRGSAGPDGGGGSRRSSTSSTGKGRSPIVSARKKAGSSKKKKSAAASSASASASSSGLKQSPRTSVNNNHVRTGSTSPVIDLRKQMASEEARDLNQLASPEPDSDFLPAEAEAELLAHTGDVEAAAEIVGGNVDGSPKVQAKRRSPVKGPGKQALHRRGSSSSTATADDQAPGGNPATSAHRRKHSRAYERLRAHPVGVPRGRQRHVADETSSSTM